MERTSRERWAQDRERHPRPCGLRLSRNRAPHRTLGVPGESPILPRGAEGEAASRGSGRGEAEHFMAEVMMSRQIMR